MLGCAFNPALRQTLRLVAALVVAAAGVTLPQPAAPVADARDLPVPSGPSAQSGRSPNPNVPTTL